uniref:protein disulfide-isomerase n=1 Tax=Geotrypetes seraphini TaxID=260995 RepID=A0A6P8Q6A9_GEOSA|nr:protein disulfide isomerase CRELD1 [Geotrypetes seraphini]
MDTPWTKLHSFQSVLVVLWLLFLSHPGYSEEEPCDICRYLVVNFKQGLEKTAGQNFGGGNTAWEEKKLAKYETSETRLLEVIEHVCDTSNFECNLMLEQSEELVETWWFKKRKQYPDLFQWLCMDTLKVCCPPGTFGPDCLSCSGGSERLCNGNGRCDGDGTRSGTGLCNCYLSYGGPFCAECSVGYYEAFRNETHLVCSECYKACSKCTGPEDDSCVLCKKGWMLHDRSCIDVDECGTEKAQCRANQFCVNLEGSYECRDCDKACVGCMGAGSARCKKCNKGYSRDGVKCLDINECNSEDPVCTGEHEVCVNAEGSHQCSCEKGYSKKDGVCTQDQQDQKGLFEDMTDDEIVVLQQMFFGVVLCALATLAAKGDMVFTAIFIGAVAAMAGYWLSERGDRLLDGFLKGR